MASLCPKYTVNCEFIKEIDNQFQVFWIEFIATTIFVSVILSVKYTNGSDEHCLNAAMIAATLLAMILYSGRISGACLNPAVGLD